MGFFFKVYKQKKYNSYPAERRYCPDSRFVGAHTCEAGENEVKNKQDQGSH